jgi:hypothetical protein
MSPRHAPLLAAKITTERLLTQLATGLFALGLVGVLHLVHALHH